MTIHFSQSNQYVKTLALDLGTTMGWAFYSPGKIIASDSVSFKPQAKLKESKHCRYLKLKKWLESFHKKFHVEQVTFELVRRHLGTDAAHVYGGLLAIVYLFVEEYNITCTGVPVKTIKKFVTGNGNASKETIIQAMKEKGHSPKDSNEGDALALLYYSLN